MTSSSNDDREALVQALMGPRVIRAAFGTWKLATHEAEAFADAILTEFLPGYTERVKAEGCKHRTSRIKFDGGKQSVVCNDCNIIITRIGRES